MCDDYQGTAWDIVNDPCWTAAATGEKFDFLVRALLFASVVAAFFLGFGAMRK